MIEEGIAKQKVLLVDDKAGVHTTLRDSLVEAGYAVETAATGSEALKKIHETAGRFQFVLLDQFLPGREDALRTVRQIHSEFPDLRMIVLALSGDGEWCREALKCGAYRYVPYPCSDQDIITVMRSADALCSLEAELRKPSLLRDIIENAGIGIGIIDRSFRILYLNQELKRITTPKCQEGGVCWSEYFGDWKTRQPCPWCPIKPAVENRVTRESVTFSGMEGDARCFRVVACPISVEGNVVGAIQFVRDITEQYRADKAVEEAGETQTRLKAALARICALGYTRARLYELSDDGTMLRGREEQGGTRIPISEVMIPLSQDACSQQALADTAPRRFSRGPAGPAPLDELMDRTDIAEWLDVPLWADGKPVGKISVDNKVSQPTASGLPKPAPDPITEEHYNQIMIVAQFVAQEIRNERERKRVQEESNRLRTLHGLWERFAQKGELAEQLQAIMEAAKLPGVVGVHLRLLREDRFELAAGLGPYYEVAKTARPSVLLSDEMSGSVRAYRQKQPVIESNAEEDAVLIALSTLLTDVPQRERLLTIKSFACFPIVCEGEVVGVLDLQSDQPGFFGPSVCTAVDELAAILASMLRLERLIGKLRSAEGRLTEAARMAAHRIGNPNYAIQSRVTRWKEFRSQGKVNDEFTRDIIEAIGGDSARMAAILEDLTRFLKEPEIHLPANPINVNVTVRRAIQGETGDRPNVEAEFQLDESLPSVVLDDQLFGEVLEELAYNACKAVRDNGRLLVQTALASREDKLEYRLSEDREFVRITLQDSGPGVEPKNKERIFDAFFTTHADGSGLGLTFVRDVVQRMGGSIRECGVWHEGARFVILVPVNPAP
ncbi:MAG: response regulator [Verrucomicrobia bacterium]|nr:response regulator [Verrucomicrobiota bacterium]